MSARHIMIGLAAAILMAGCTGDAFLGNRGGQDAENQGTQETVLPEYEPNSPEYFANLVGDRVYFEVDKSIVSTEAAATLRQQAQWLNRNPDFTVTVEGHADEQGTREYNLALGARRASAVRDYLVGLGIVSHRISTVTYGKERPVAVCSNESCWSRNRRSVSALQQQSAG